MAFLRQLRVEVVDGAEGGRGPVVGPDVGLGHADQPRALGGRAVAGDGVHELPELRHPHVGVPREQVLEERGARAEEPDEAWIKHRVEQVKKAEINGWRQIPWVASLLEARRLSGQEKKFLFLVSHDGNIDTGRC